MKATPDMGNAAREIDLPARASDVELLGAMPGAAFAERQCLVRRGGAYLQLTEVLYRILELADGAHTIERIAAYVSAMTRRSVNAADVRELMRTKLLPAGLLRGAGPAPAPARALSPLQVNLRAFVLGPRAVDVIARVMAPLYAPGVALALLVGTIGTRLWLYAHHGIGDALHDVVSRPAVMPILVALVIASAAFHEVGHAAALRRAGARARGIGLGFYLMYPVFYTDVTESYRLGRWRRVLTDIGGFYFNLIFALAVAGAYVVTGEQFLLASVMLTDVEILHQLLPLGRLDGYWILADVTGVPDFFANAGAFVRGLLPFGDPSRPTLRPVARAVCAGYLLAVFPLFALLAYLVARSFPRLLAASLGSFLKQSDAFEAARASGDLPGGAGAIVQATLLVLPLLAIALFFTTLAAAMSRVLWRTSGRSRVERVVGAASVVGAALLVALVWTEPLAPLRAATANAVIEAPERVARAVRELDTASPGAASERVIPLVTSPPIRIPAPRATPIRTPTPQTVPPTTSAPATPSTKPPATPSPSLTATPSPSTERSPSP